MPFTLPRRAFTRSLLGIPALFSTAGLTSKSWKCVHHITPHRTAVHIEGLGKSCRVLQISDSHISILNEQEKEFDQYGQRMHNAFRKVKHFSTGEEGLTTDYFKGLMAFAQAEKVDLIALSGDILNYPSPTGVAFVKEQLQQTGIPHMYTSGNHDWHYEGMEGTADELRDYWCRKSLAPLYPDGIYASSRLVGAVNVVMIDNSTYQVNEEQLAFFRKELDKGYPIVLIVHIPLYTLGMGMCCGHPAWGWDSDRGFEIERRQRWPKSGNLKSTEAFVKEVMTAPGVVGIFAGHWHRFHTVGGSGPVQQLALPAFSGQYRLIDFLPA